MYFSQVSLDGRLFVDGGLVANNPTELAIFEAHHMFEDANLDWFVVIIDTAAPSNSLRVFFGFSILSIGTGVPSKAAGSVNIFKMLSEIIDICTSSNSIHERVAEWIHMMPEPRPNYFRLNPTGGVGSLPLDTSDPKVLENVEKATEEYMKTPAAREIIDRIKSILSKRPTPEPKEEAPIHASRLDNSV
jgi:patatin-like phospholipase/acyl hydrolase